MFLSPISKNDLIELFNENIQIEDLLSEVEEFEKNMKELIILKKTIFIL